MNTLIALAIILNTIDASYTCARLNRGDKELNPLFPNNCAGIIAMKSGVLLVTPLFKSHKKSWLIGITAGSSIGITISLVRRQK